MSTNIWTGALEMFNDDEPHKVYYYPDFCEMAGSKNAGIFLGRVLYWRQELGRNFYKFNEPCDHPSYNEGHSWLEELGFTRSELRSAIDDVSTRVMSDDDKDEVFTENVVIRWKDGYNRLWWDVNLAVLASIYNAHKNDAGAPTGIFELIDYVGSVEENASASDHNVSEKEARDML